MNYNQAQQLALKTKWEVVECSTKDCWCAGIKPATKIEYEEDIRPNNNRHDDGDNYNEEYWICGFGSMEKEVAEHIVRVHNAFFT